MPSTIDIIRHSDTEGTHIVRSHVLHPHEEITIICIIRSLKDNVLSVIEDHLLESISSTGWDHGDEEADFAYVTEKFNQFQRNLAQEDMKEVSALFSVMYEDELMLTVTGNMCGLLRTKDGNLSMIAENKDDGTEFTSVSNGKIPKGGQIFLSSSHFSSFLSDDFFDECGDMTPDSFQSTLEGILKRDAHETTHIIRIHNPGKPDTRTGNILRSSQKMSRQIDIARGAFHDIKDSIIYNEFFIEKMERIRVFLGSKNTYLLVTFLITGSILFFLLVYTLINTLFQVANNPQVDIKNQILTAQTLIDESQKLTSNSEAFNAKISEAENILFALRDKQEYMTDTQKLLQKIEAMKKEMYDIQTIDLKKYKSIVSFNPSDISPLGVFEFNKKLHIIGKNSAIFGYVRGNPLPAVSSYPPGEEAIDMDMTEDGEFYILTKNSRILSTRRNDVTYVNVTGQDSWEKASKIATFNNNVYLIDNVGGQIFKHKPGVNGFSQKTEVLTNTLSGIVDIGIDGGFYIATDEPKMYRMISKEGFSQSGIILNKIPGEYTVGKNGDAQIFIRGNLNFIYILSDNKIWMFEPDSKRFQDIRSWTYLAQLEISTDEEIRTISVPRDGMIYVTTNLGIYEVGFEFVDKNIILKN